MLDEIVHEKIDTVTGQFHPYFKIAYAYTEAGQMSQYLEFRWDDSLNQWQPSFKEEVTYDGNGNLAQRMAFALVENKNTGARYPRFCCGVEDNACDVIRF